MPRDSRRHGARLDYLSEHFAMNLTLKRHLAVIDLIALYIHGMVLEWRCQNALGSCVYRMRFEQRRRRACGLQG